MLVTWLLSAILTAIQALFGALPSMPADSSWVGYSTVWAGEFASLLSGLDVFVDLSDIWIALSVWFLVITPGLFLYLFPQWAYRELPHIAGTGS